MKTITGEKFRIDSGIIVVCDPECINGIRILPGEHVLFEGKEYVFVCAVMTVPGIDQWSLLLKEPEE